MGEIQIKLLVNLNVFFNNYRNSLLVNTICMIKHGNNYIIIVDYSLNTYKSNKNIL